MVKEITKDNFDKEVIAANGKVLVDFWASWCGPCMMLGPIVDEVSEKLNLARQTVDTEVKLVLSNSFGFGGTNSALVIRKFE